MTSIVEIGQYRPQQVLLASRQRELALTDQELRRYQRAFGYERVCIDPDLTEADLLTAAIEDIAGFETLRCRVRHVIRARTVRFPSPYPHDPLVEVCRRTGLDRGCAVTITDQACAGGLFAVDLAGALLSQKGEQDALAVVLLGEKALARCTQIIPGIGILGEATVAVVVSGTEGSGREPDQVIGFASRTHPVSGSGLTMDEQATREFSASYAEHLSGVIHLALHDAGLTVTDLDHYLPHNVSRLACEYTARQLGIPRHKVFTDNIPELAHNWSADGFLNYRSVIELGLLHRGETYLMTSVGLGATYAAMVVRH